MMRYRRLPGARRGFINSSSVWLGDDHLLLVKSMRFREEYKRFHLRDIQAIAVAGAPRFHISTRAAGIGLLWLLAVWVGALVFPRVAQVSTSTGPTIAGTTTTTSMVTYGISPIFWIAAAVLVALWIYVSAAMSCRCRIYTAVSSDELPSVYRSWTARKFLAAVEPKIAEVQGVVEGEWAEAAEAREIGPAASAGPDAGLLDAVGAPSHTLASDLFIAALFASGLVAFLTLNLPPLTARYPAIGFMLLKVGLGLVLFVQHYKGKLRTGMQRVAIAALLVMGGIYYAQQMVEGIRVGAESAANKRVMAPIAPVLVSSNRFVSEVDGGASILLGCVGLGIVLVSKDRGD